VSALADVCAAAAAVVVAAVVVASVNPSGDETPQVPMS